MRLPRTRGPGHRLSVPVGLALSRTPHHVKALNVPSRSRRQVARALLDCMAEPLPGRPLRRLADGGDATKDSGRQGPEAAQVVGRWPIGATLSPVPSQPPPSVEAPRANKATCSPTTLAQTATGWAPHPSEDGAERPAWCGLWHAVLPGRRIRVVVRRRDGTRATKRPGPSPPPALAAFCTTALTWSAQDILHAYRARGAVAMAIREAGAVDGLGQAQCRKRQRLLGANPFRLGMAAARTRWFIAPSERGIEGSLCRYRPWDRQTGAPSHLDGVWACREALHQAGIFPLPRFTPDRAEHHEEPADALPLAA
jgi:hypothetical protein